MTRVIRFGPGAIAELEPVLAECGAERALVVTTARGARSARSLPAVAVYDGVRPHVPAETVHEVAALARAQRADSLVGFGGGSAIDTCKAAVAELAGDRREALPLVIAVPTTYAGAEWTPFFGVLLAPGRKGSGADERATPVAAIYDPELTLDLPLRASVGTAMNALAHCAEALYHPATNERARRHALDGAAALGRSLPDLPAAPRSLAVRTPLLEGAMHAALALAESGLCLGHALAQALGGRYGLAQGEMNAICLPAALRFNADVAAGALAALADAFARPDAVAYVEELARLGGFPLRLREHGVPADELPQVADAVVARAGARANPRPVAAADVLALLRSLW
ncbi:MAG TPA: iron-containing alcohol dehydrogenase [Gaiellaceae bacterium]|nr:iron-containing alcohol dehydrogenase [Gaiellaceae bacterium]